MAAVIPIKVAQRLERLYLDGVQAQAAAGAIADKYNEARAVALEILGLDPEQNIGINFKTGLIRPPPTEIRPIEESPEPAATTSDVTDSAEQPA